MRASSFTFNFRVCKHPLKTYFFTLIVSFYGVFLLSLMLFYFKPHLFYWRAWEFFEEIVYHRPGCNIFWDQEEKGDMSRRYTFFVNQAEWKTKVSCDAEGFRSVPYHATNYPILVVGDSHTWGSGLSDHDTLPWRLAESLQIPVFNGGKWYFREVEQLLMKENLQNTSLIIEFVQSPIFCKANLKKLKMEESFTLRPYESQVTPRAFFWDFPILQRFFLPYKFFRFLSPERIFRSWKQTLEKGRILQIARYDGGKTVEDLEYTVAQMARRANEIKRLGYNYVLIPIPVRQMVLIENVTPQTLWWESEFVKRLQEQGVLTVDLLPLFREHRHEGIYLETDSHWNAKGIELALSEIIPYLKQHRLLEETRNTKPN